MYFVVDNKITVKDATPDFIKWCHDELELSNPEYDKKSRMGLWTGNTPRKIFLYERNGNDFVVPFGCVKRLMTAYPDCAFKSRIRPVRPFGYWSNIKLYEYQEGAVKAMLVAKNGILVMPCGGGKTQTALEVIARLGVKTLWLTHTQDLLNQSLNRAKVVLCCPAYSYGTITGGKVNIGNGLTFATVQTMSKLDLTAYKDTFDCVVVDECHRAVGSPTKVMQFYKVLSNLSCRYKFGVTATPRRSDGLEKSMFALIGDIIYEVEKDAVKNSTCPVKVQFVNTDYMPDINKVLLGDGTLNYSELVNDLVGNQERFKLVLETIKKLPIGSPVLVLGNRVEYLDGLNNAYCRRSKCLSSMGNSKAAKAERKEALKALNDGEIDCLFATYQLAKEGLDIPNLRYVVFATPEKDSTTITQSAGRVGRKADGKPFGTVIDFVDCFGMYQGWAKTRKNIYKKLGFEILT